MEYSLTDRAWIWLNSAAGVNVRLSEELLFLNDGLLPLFEAARGSKPIRLPERIRESVKGALYANASEAFIDSLLEQMGRKNVKAVTRNSPDYPALLREIYDPPTVLFVKGELKTNAGLPIAVIGARKCTDYGREMAERFGRELALNGACVVSGMAAGCDSIAAWSSLGVGECEYPTVAVLGSGVDVVYPSNNLRLYSAIAERGAVVSEYPMGSRPSKESFPRRNRIISGMSKGVLVIEAAAKSGTSITAGFANDQGRDVFAVPGRLTDLMSAGTNALIRRGEAKPVFGVEDILTEYGTFSARKAPVSKEERAPSLPEEQRRIYDELRKGERSPDSLCDRLGVDISEVNIYLTEMELSGIIKKLQNGQYSV